MVISKNDKFKAVDVGGLIDLVRGLLPQEGFGATSAKDGGVQANPVKVEPIVADSSESECETTYFV